MGVILLAQQAIASLEAQTNPIHGTVSFPQETPLTTPTTTQPYVISVIVADFDGDGLADVAAASQFPSKVAWYRNNGDDTFGQQLVISTALLAPSCIFAADIDGDGAVDLAASSQFDNEIVWFKNVGGALADGLFGYNPLIPGSNVRVVSTAINFPLSVSVADLNGDGLPDILSTSSYDNKVAWYRNLGAGDFGFNPIAPTANQNVVSTAGASPSSVVATDLDGDGIRDLVVTSVNDNTLAWFKGSISGGGPPQFTRYVISSNQLRATTAAIADFDGDGWSDVVCGAPYGNSTTWFRNRTHDSGVTAPFFGPGQVISGNTHGVWSVAAADLNSDGRPDVLAASLSDNKVSWYENLGAGNFGWNAAVPAANEKLITTGAQGAIAVTASDFNLDGTMDVAAGSQDDGKVFVYLNRGGQCALASADTAPASIIEGHQDDVLRISVSNRGLAGDDNARVDTLGLLFEKGAGVSLATSEANALIENLRLYVDSNGSTLFEPGADTMIATVSDLQLTNGRLAFPVNGGSPSDAQVPPGTTRNYFLVTEIAANAATQNPNTFRVTHLRRGAGHSIVKDAISGAVLTIEWSPNPEPPSSWVTAAPAPISSIADLSNLTVSSTSLVPTFASAIHDYSATVPNGVSSVTVTPTAVNPLSMITVNGVSVASGTASGPISLVIGSTSVPVVSTAQDGSNSITYTISVARQTYYQTWAAGYNLTGPNSGPNADFEFDGLVNLLEMAFGTNPTVGGEGTIVVNPPNIVQRGTPTTRLDTTNGVDFRALYGRRKDYIAAGLTYTVQFSGDLITWENSTAIPTVIADDGEIEAVTVPYPFFVNGLKARFFRVQVTSQ